MKYEYQNFQRRSDLVIPILGVWSVEFDWSRFLRMSATCLDKNEGLKQALEVFSVLQFCVKNAKFASQFWCSSGRVVLSDPLHMCYVTCFGRNYGLIMQGIQT